jgi:hypothetical protein
MTSSEMRKRTPIIRKVVQPGSTTAASSSGGATAMNEPT